MARWNRRHADVALSLFIAAVSALHGPFELIAAAMFIGPAVASWMILPLDRSGPSVLIGLGVLFGALYGWSQLPSGMIPAPFVHWADEVAVYIA